MQTLPVALLQTPPVFLNLPASIDRAVDLIDETARAGARLIVFPETWLPGYPVWLDEAPGSAMWGHAPAERMFQRLFDHAPALDGPELARLAQAAAERRVEVVMGLHERLGASLYNTMLFIDAEGGRRIHRKLTPTFNERLIWAQGDGSTLQAFPRPYGVLGGLVCWEHWMPLARAAMHAQTESVHVAQWPAVGEMHQIASRQYAFEGQCFVLASGCVLTRDDVLDGFDSVPEPDPVARELLETIPPERIFLKDGGSAVVAPDGSYVAGPVYRDARTVRADLDLSRVGPGRMYLDSSGHYARPDVFERRVDTRPRLGVNFTNG
ncbi:MAG: carbon-nitrogen hydrolase family protein [Proteobacteria bacterium]|nr:carbon-nitrogen hydrolase family protein [Pseudomonadota bacterium]